jgi:predicted nucleotidyltransferase
MRTSITDDQRLLIDALQRLLEAQPRIEAAWLAGSLGAGGGDRFSDVDILVLAVDAEAGEVSTQLQKSLALPELEPVLRPVLVNALFGGRVLNVVTADWGRFDLVVVHRADLDRYNRDALQPLFNRGVSQPPSRPDQPYRTSPPDLLKLVQEFLRVLGLAVVGLGRAEYEVSLAGVDLLRRMTIDLMLEENGVAPAQRGGALRRNPLLTAGQRAELAGLPPVMADREGLLAANSAFARLFLPRAHRLAAEIGMAWPTELEAATARHLWKHLGQRI